LRTKQQEQLEREGGFCIVATHFGKGYAVNGKVNEMAEARLRELAGRPGWFAPVGELLDFLAARKSGHELTRREWHAMQWRWAWDLAMRKLRARYAPKQI
jgi:hypothetical protein